MANPEHVEILRKGKDAWNKWREENPQIKPDLIKFGADENVLPGWNIEVEDNFSGWNLRDVDLRFSFFIRPKFQKADLSGATLSKSTIIGGNFLGAIVSGCSMVEASMQFCNFSDLDFRTVLLAESNFSCSNFSHADLSNVYLKGVNLSETDLSHAILNNTELCKANLNQANCTHAKFTNANLEFASMVSTNFTKADLTGCRVFGVSAWDLKLKDSIQANLIITKNNEPKITVDNLEVAQFMYLMLNNKKIQQMIDTVTSSVVFILGSFKEERKQILDSIRDELRHRDFTPVQFDFKTPESKDKSGTVEMLARMARFIIVDLTDPNSVPHELGIIVPFLRTTPILPIILKGTKQYGMFKDFQESYQWVLETYEYSDAEDLIASLDEIIESADKMAEEFRNNK